MSKAMDANHDSIWAAALGFLGLVVIAAWTRVSMMVGWKHKVDYDIRDLQLARGDFDRQMTEHKIANDTEFAHVRNEMRRRFSEVVDKLDKTHDLAVEADAKLDLLIKQTKQ